MLLITVKMCFTASTVYVVDNVYNRSQNTVSHSYREVREFNPTLLHNTHGKHLLSDRCCEPLVCSCKFSVC